MNGPNDARCIAWAHFLPLKPLPHFLPFQPYRRCLLQPLLLLLLLIHEPTAEYVKPTGRVMSSRGLSDLTVTSTTEFQPTICFIYR